MEDARSSKPIGFFDSGVGGISVLKKTIELMPGENFIYFGDSKNAPYGVRPLEEVKRLTFEAVEFLLSRGCKAIVIACNTATSVAIEDLREAYNHIPIIGIEPALKPAIEVGGQGKILIMATPITLAEKKFNNLVKLYGSNSDVSAVPCPGLAELIENGVLSGEELNNYLREKLKEFLNTKISSIVLGCTHYPFIKQEIINIIGKDISIIDGSEGTARELMRKLDKNNMLNTSTEKGTVEIVNSSKEKSIIELSYKLLGIDRD